MVLYRWYYTDGDIQMALYRWYYADDAIQIVLYKLNNVEFTLHNDNITLQPSIHRVLHITTGQYTLRKEPYIVLKSKKKRAHKK